MEVDDVHYYEYFAKSETQKNNRICEEMFTFFICLILLTTIDNLIADRVSKNWHPTLGFVFGVSIVACVGFFWLFPVLKK